MSISNCIPLLFPGLAIVETAVIETRLCISVQSTDPSAACTKCGAVSKRVHSSYLRHVQDTPIGLFLVWLKIKVRRFRCDNPECKSKTFAEQFPDLVGRRRRRTTRLLAQLSHICLALGGAAGARLAGKLAMTASGSTLLRLLHKLEAPLPEEPRIIGLDEWAFRKGRNYGTIIVDHESGKPIDLLPDRDSETVQEWLEKHPTIEVVTRDRSGEYRNAINEALPEAVQVADRWHLLKNMVKAIQRYFSRHRKAVRKLVVGAVEAGEFNPTDLKVTEKYRRYYQGPGRDSLHEARQEEREALFAAVKARRAEGVYTTDIADEFDLSRQTVSKWVNSESLPPDGRGRFKRKCLIDDYVPYLRQRIANGCTNKSQLWREIKEQGFTGSRTIVGKWVRQNYSTNGETTADLSAKKVKVTLPSSRELAWLIVRHGDELEEEEKQLLDVLMRDGELAELRQAAHEFMHIVRNALDEEWASWLKSSCSSAVKELKNFAEGLKKDGAAVYEAIRQAWSNGPTEGHVNRLKFLKRQMYGRASFELLRLRVLLAD
ncbi:MAG TPA: ISL3 family transposase [Candidatus Sulfomarinibacteraceae bacterium]|nr:ISL3 family transposase [Candidatus Sulfomarinibacteraceae bacterium]